VHSKVSLIPFAFFLSASRYGGKRELSWETLCPSSLATDRSIPPASSAAMASGVISRLLCGLSLASWISLLQKAGSRESARGQAAYYNTKNVNNTARFSLWQSLLSALSGLFLSLTAEKEFTFFGGILHPNGRIMI